jgi:type I restriction enzyme S subunit
MISNFKFVPLEEILESYIGGLWGDEPGQSEIDVKVMRITELGSNGKSNLSTAAIRSVSAKQLASRKLNTGDLVLEKSGGGPNTPVGRVALIEELPEDFICSNFMLLMRPDESVVQSRYLHHFLTYLHVTGQTIPLQSSSTNIRNISTPDYMQIEVPLPLLDVQSRIVEALDDHLSRLDKALADVEAVYRSSNLLRMSALETALKKGFPTVRLEQLVVGSGYGTSTKCVAGGLGVPVARIPNLVNGSIDMTDEKRAQDLTVDLKNLMLSPGDLLVIRTNGSQSLVGTTAVVPENINASFASYLIRFQVNRSKVHPEWVHQMFGSLGVRKQIVELSASSAGQYNLGLSKLNSIEIPLPSIQDQERILEATSHLESRLDSVQRERDILLTSAESLRKSILNEAFSGGLQNA